MPSDGDEADYGHNGGDALNLDNTDKGYNADDAESEPGDVDEYTNFTDAIRAHIPARGAGTRARHRSR